MSLSAYLRLRVPLADKVIWIPIKGIQLMDGHNPGDRYRRQCRSS